VTRGRLLSQRQNAYFLSELWVSASACSVCTYTVGLVARVFEAFWQGFSDRKIKVMKAKAKKVIGNWKILEDNCSRGL